MCFAPQRRALFRHLNFQKRSGPGVFCTFWLGNVLRATTACTFSTSQLPKVVWTWCVLYILTSKCASRHNGVQFFISHLASWLRTRRFSEPTFRPSGAKHSVSQLSYLFAHLDLLSSALLSSTLLSSTLSLLSDHFHLCFSSVHIVGSLTSKLPSMKWKYLKLVVSEELENWIFKPVLTFGAHSARKGGPRTIHAEGCAGLIYSHLTTRLCVRHARSPQRVARNQDKFAFHHTFVHLTRAISAEGRVSQFGFWLPLLP